VHWLKQSFKHDFSLVLKDKKVGNRIRLAAGSAAASPILTIGKR
jgi:hypothetical protein